MSRPPALGNLVHETFKPREVGDNMGNGFELILCESASIVVQRNVTAAIELFQIPWQGECGDILASVKMLSEIGSKEMLVTLETVIKCAT